MGRGGANLPDESSDREYSETLLLEDMESLLEGIEEQVGVGGEPTMELGKRLTDLGVASVTELRTRILSLHERLDAEAGM